MTPASIPAPPRLDPALIDALRADLRAAPYTVAATEETLGETAIAALRRHDPIPARRVLGRCTDPGAVLPGVFNLGVTVRRELLEAALPDLTVAGAIELGLIGEAEPGGERVRALIDLTPYDATDDLGEIRWWIASDLSELATGRTLHPDHVVGVGSASATLVRLTPRDRVGTVLDVGCGGGIQALHASRHADRVVATDVSGRALAFAAFTAAVNEIDLDLRQGPLLGPAHGETFDLIVSNPPFVIVPRGAFGPTWTYLDGGEAGDTLLSLLLEELPAHLAPGGTAVMLGNWEIGHDEPWDEHPRAWTSAAADDGVDAWVIQREREDVAQYAETWARDGGITPRDDRWEPMIGAWLDDFASRDVESVGFGYLLLHRPPPADGVGREAISPGADHPGGTSRGAVLCEQVASSGSGSLGEHVGEALRTASRLARLDDAALLATRPVRAADVVERRHVTPGQWDPIMIELVQGAGFGRIVPVSQAVAGTVGACDGTLTLEQIIAAVCALTDTDPELVQQDELPRVRDLMRWGFLRP